MICVIIMFPLFMFLAVIGARIYAVITDTRDDRRSKTLVVAAFAILPFIAGPIEARFNNPDDFRRVENTVLINAPAAVVWQHIIRVAPIPAQDLGHSLIDDIGFPRPMEATLTREGVGGVRHATFERGVGFIETVDEWVLLQRLSFSIVPNTATIPPTTFDEPSWAAGFPTCCAAPTSCGPPARTARAWCCTASSASAPTSIGTPACGPAL